MNSKENENTATAVCIASTINYPTIVKRLIESGADIHFPQSDGKDPLICAAICGNLDCVGLLLKAGAELKNTFQNFNALEHSMLRQNMDVVDLIKEHFKMK